MHEKSDAADALKGLEISLFDVLNFLNKYIKIILGISFIAGLLAAVIEMRVPDVYTARLTMAPSSQTMTPSSQVQLIQPVMESGSFADTLVRRFDLTRAYGAKSINMARDLLMGHTRIKIKDAIIVVEVDDVDPKRAAALANAYPEELNKFIASRELTDAVRQRKKIEFRIKDLQASLALVNKKLDETEKKAAVDLLSDKKYDAVEFATLRAQLDMILEMDANTNISKVIPNLDRLRQQLEYQCQQDTTKVKKLIKNADQNYLEQFSKAKYLEESIELLKTRQQLSVLDEQMNITQVLDMATVPEKKSNPKRLLPVVSTMIIAAILSILVMLLKEWVAIIRKQLRQAGHAL